MDLNGEFLLGVLYLKTNISPRSRSVIRTIERARKARNFTLFIADAYGFDRSIGIVHLTLTIGN
jgi:hypothetical protein